MLSSVPATPYDLRFSVVGIPVRVHPVFWLSSLFLAWEPERLDLIVVRVFCIFLAILVHELGHAVVTRRFGWSPEIVLYFFGGYATTQRHSTWKDIAVSAAGPGAGFLLYLAIRYLAIAGLQAGVIDPDNEIVRNALDFSLFINLVWNVLNLVPVLPLDGGQICREFCLWLRPRTGLEISMQISIAASGAMTVWAISCIQQKGTSIFGLDPKFMAVMFGYLCYQGYQTLQQQRRGYW